MADTISDVLVTGASGFVGKHIVRELLASGFAVRGTVRSDQRRAEVEALFPDARLELVRADLTSDDGWAGAVAGVDAVIHTASPLPMKMPRDRRRLIEPAVDGTQRVLEEARSAGVRRVVLTSSCGAIYKDPAKPREAPSDESHWTDPDGSDTSAYEASKTLAERAAWGFARLHPEMQLTVLNPSMVLGPALDAAFGMSLAVIERLLSGRDPMLPDLDIPIVDVRDVARAHVAVLDDPATFGQRIVLNAGTLGTIEAVTVLAAAYPDRRVTVRTAPDWIVRLAAPFSVLARQAVANLGRNCHVDGSTGARALGTPYVPARDALLAAADFVVGCRG